MNNTKLFITVLVVMIGAIALMGFKIMTADKNTGKTNSGSSAISLTTDPNPLAPGKATFMIEVNDKNGKPVDNAKVFFDLNMTTMNMGTQQGNATSMGNGRYSAIGQMSMRGPWRVATKVTMPDGSIESKDFIVNVP